MDLLESGDDREPRRPTQVRLPGWAVALIGTLAVALPLGGLGAVAHDRREQAREAARLEIDVLPAGTSSTTVRGVARGELSLLLVNRREHRVRLGQLRIVAGGLRVTSVVPAFGKPLGPYEERLFTIGYVVPDCTRLVLPGRLLLSLAADGQLVQRREVALVDPAGAATAPPGSVRIAACPDSARTSPPGQPTDVAVRAAGGEARRVGAGVEGFVRLQVRNAGPPVQLLSVDGDVPGVRFVLRVLDGGRTLVTDEVVSVRLAFRIEDCARLVRTGRLVLRIERFGGVQEVGLRLTAEPVARVGPQVALPQVLDACG